LYDEREAAKVNGMLNARAAAKEKKRKNNSPIKKM